MDLFEDNYNLDDVVPGKHKSKHKELISQLKCIEEDDFSPSSGFTVPSFLPSSMLKEQPKKKKKEKDETEYDPDSWFNEMMSYKSTKINKKGNKKFDLFDVTGESKKKKKKKKEKDDLMDYKKEFEPEMALFKNLLMDQNRYTESLQKEYDAIKSVKSSSRGITKQMTDLEKNINDARSLAMQLVEKHVNTKKLIADLTLKQKKELGLGVAEGENMADFASSYLKQLFNERQSLMSGTYGDNTIADYTEEEIFNELSNSLLDEESRPEEVDLYLKYENRNVKIYVVITDDDIENYEFVAKDEEGDVIDDYPLPNHTSISVNRSTNIATDIFGKKYTIIWE